MRHSVFYRNFFLEYLADINICHDILKRLRFDICFVCSAVNISFGFGSRVFLHTVKSKWPKRWPTCVNLLLLPSPVFNSRVHRVNTEWKLVWPAHVYVNRSAATIHDALAFCYCSSLNLRFNNDLCTGDVSPGSICYLTSEMPWSSQVVQLWLRLWKRLQTLRFSLWC